MSPSSDRILVQFHCKPWTDAPYAGEPTNAKNHLGPVRK
jgi:hypothetical protein